MTNVIASVGALLFGMALMSTGNGLLGILLPLRLAQTDSGSMAVGMIMSGFFFGLVVGVYVGRHLIVRVGHIRAFTAFMAVLAASVLSHPFLLDGWFWFVLRIIQGICLAGLYMCTESWLNERSSHEQRGQVMSLYMITLYVGISLGQLLLNVPDPSGFALYALIAILISLAAVPVAAARIVPPALPEYVPFNLKKLHEISPLGIGGAAIAGVILGAFYGLAPFFTTRMGLDTAGTSQFMAYTILGGLLLQWPIGKLSDRYDRRKVIMLLGFAICAVALAIVGLSLWTTVGLLVTAPFLGGVMFTLYPLCISHTNDYIDATDLVPASAGLILAYGIGAAIGPLAAAGAMNVVGPLGLFGFIAVMGLITGLYASWRQRQRPAPPVEDQAPFQAVQRTTPVAAELDPRGEPTAETVVFPFRDKDGNEIGGEIDEK
ncbi:MAG: MFS transporter, partial [Rhodospirillales bacterium]